MVGRGFVLGRTLTSRLGLSRMALAALDRRARNGPWRAAPVARAAPRSRVRRALLESTGPRGTTSPRWSTSSRQDLAGIAVPLRRDDRLVGLLRRVLHQPPGRRDRGADAPALRSSAQSLTGASETTTTSSSATPGGAPRAHPRRSVPPRSGPRTPTCATDSAAVGRDRPRSRADVALDLGGPSVPANTSRRAADGHRVRQPDELDHRFQSARRAAFGGSTVRTFARRRRRPRAPGSAASSCGPRSPVPRSSAAAVPTDRLRHSAGERAEVLSGSYETQVRIV